jgi:hypothetical protein
MNAEQPQRTDAAPQISPADDEFTVESLDGGPPSSLGGGLLLWRHIRLPRWLTRRRITLGAVALALIAIVLATIAGETGRLWTQARWAWLQRTAPTLTQFTILPRTGGTVASGRWQAVPLPMPISQYRWFAAAPNDPETAYACGGPALPQQSQAQIFTDGQMTLLHTHDGGAHWNSVALPSIQGFSCKLEVARDDAQRLALSSLPLADCADERILVSDDSGQSWHVSSLPAPPARSIPGCYLDLGVSGRHLYARQNFPGTADPDSLLRSDDDGHTWHALNDEMPPAGQGLLPTLSADGNTLVLPVQVTTPDRHAEDGTRLWISRDAGESWAPLGIMKAFSTDTLLDSAPTVEPTPSHPLYALSETHVPDELFRVRIAEIASGKWALLPPLPISGTSADRLGIAEVLTATPSGKLLALGLGPAASLVGGNAATIYVRGHLWLWEWDPIAARWSVFAPALPVPPPCGDHCWLSALSIGQGPDGAGTYLWLSAFGDRGPTAPLRVRLPAG